MARATKEEAARTAARIVAVAGRRYARDGYAAVAVDDVAGDAGVTRGAVYHHFGSRDGLFAAVHDAAQQAVSRAVLAAADGVEDPAEQLRAGCAAFLAAAAAPEHRRILLIDAPAVLGWDRWRRADAEHAERSLREGLDALVTAGRLAHVDVAALVPALSGAMNEAALWAARSGQPDGLARAQDAVRLLVDAVLR